MFLPVISLTVAFTGLSDFNSVSKKDNKTEVCFRFKRKTKKLKKNDGVYVVSKLIVTAPNWSMTTSVIKRQK